MDEARTGARRVGVLERPTRYLSEELTAPPDPYTPEARLLQLLQQVAERVRAGRYEASDGEGILLDTVVGDSRYVLLVQEPTLAVRLSPREQEIARMVAAGRTNAAIAGALDISIWTVSTHLRRIFAKLAVGSRAEMVAHLGQNTIVRVTRAQTTTVIPPST